MADIEKPESVESESAGGDLPLEQGDIDTLFSQIPPTGAGEEVEQPVITDGTSELPPDGADPPVDAAAEAALDAAAGGDDLGMEAVIEQVSQTSEAETAVETLPIEVDQTQIDDLVASAAAAETAGTGTTDKLEIESGPAPDEGESDPASLSPPADAPVGAQVAALLDDPLVDEPESVGAPGPAVAVTPDDVDALLSDAVERVEEVPEAKADPPPVALESESGSVDPKPEAEPVAEAPVTEAAAQDAVLPLEAAAAQEPSEAAAEPARLSTLKPVLIAAVSGVAAALLVALALGGLRGEPQVETPEPETIVAAAPPAPPPAPEPEPAPNRPSFVSRQPTRDELLALALGRWPLPEPLVAAPASAPARRLPRFEFSDPAGDGVAPETGAPRRPHFPEADIVRVRVRVLGAGGEPLRPADVTAAGYAKAGTEIRIAVDMAAPLEVLESSFYRFELVGRFRDARPDQLAPEPAGALVPGSQVAVTLEYLDGAWSGQWLVWNPQLGTAVPLGKFTGFEVAQNRIELRLPVALLQPLMAPDSLADSFDFFVRVLEVVGSRSVVDSVGHGQRLETSSAELLELTEALLTQPPAQAVERWAELDPLEARVVARQALSMMELPSTLFMLSAPLAR